MSSDPPSPADGASTASTPADGRGVVVITGMHRSGTSLLAGLMQAAGVSVGKRLMEATEFNPRGYFEDLDFQELHEEILAHNGIARGYLDLPHRPLRIEPRHRERARELIERRGELPLWGWKDPRTLLFLDMWAELLPDAVFVFIYRDPCQVVDSLRRRHDVELLWNFPGAALMERLGFQRFRLPRAVSMWLLHNRRLVRFAARHPERCIVLDVAHAADHFDEVVQRLRSDWGLAVHAVDVSELYDSGLLGVHASPEAVEACRKNPEVASVHAKLRQLSRGNS